MFRITGVVSYTEVVVACRYHDEHLEFTGKKVETLGPDALPGVVAKPGVGFTNRKVENAAIVRLRAEKLDGVTHLVDDEAFVVEAVFVVEHAGTIKCYIGLKLSCFVALTNVTKNGKAAYHRAVAVGVVWRESGG